MIYIIIEKAYQNTTWCNALLSGIISELNRNHLKYSVHSDMDIETPETNSFSLILCNTINWSETIVNKSIASKIRPFLITSYNDFSPAINRVFFDMYSNIQELHNYLVAMGKTKTALFAFKKVSPANALIIKYFSDFFDESSQSDIYVNSISVNDSFEEFFKNIDKYDSVICANAHVAVFLINKLRENKYPISKITFVSYGDSILLSKTISNAVIVSQPHKKCGQTAVSLIKTLIKHPDITNLSASIKCHIYNYETTPTLDMLLNNSRLDPSYTDNSYIAKQDPEISQIMQIEILLESCSQLELKIIDLLISGLTYEQIADICSMSPNAIKYHIKKMLQKINCCSKKEFEKLLGKYNYGN